jgi:hypothetical protein
MTTSRDAILLVWADMVSTMEMSFRRIQSSEKYSVITRILFNASDFSVKLENAVRAAGGRRLKLFIIGHGDDKGTDSIRSNAGLANQDPKEIRTIAQLAQDLACLGTRAAKMEGADSTEIFMNSCRFGRPLDGKPETAPAAKLHALLGQRGIFVSLVARTLDIYPAWATPAPNKTVSKWHADVSLALKKNPAAALSAEVGRPHSKLKWTYEGGRSVVLIRSYKNKWSWPYEVDTSAMPDWYTVTDLQARRFLWAEDIVDKLIQVLEWQASAQPAAAPSHNTTGDKAFSDMLGYYEVCLDPAWLRDKLAQQAAQAPPRIAAILPALLNAYPSDGPPAPDTGQVGPALGESPWQRNAENNGWLRWDPNARMWLKYEK